MTVTARCRCPLIPVGQATAASGVLGRTRRTPTRIATARIAGTTAIAGSGRRERGRSGPGNRRKRFGKRRDARRRLPAAKLAALRLGAKVELDRGRRRGRRGDAQRGDDRRRSIDERQRQQERREHQRDASDHRFDLRPHDLTRGERRRGDEVRRVLAGNREPGKAAGELPRRHHQHRHEEHHARPAVLEALPQQEGRRQEIEHLHQSLRHQPGIAPQQRPFLVAQHLASATPAESRWPAGPRGSSSVPAAAVAQSAKRGATRTIAAPSIRRLVAHEHREREGVAEHGARRPPQRAVGIGREGEDRLGGERGVARHACLRRRSPQAAGR